MASIRKKNGKWQVQVRRKSFPTVSRTFTKKSDATEWAHAMEAKADRRDMPNNPKVLEDITLRELVQRYMQEFVSKKKSADVETAILKAFLRHKLCDRRLANITHSDWVKYRDERLLKISAKSLSRQLSPIQNMFHVAQDIWDIPVPSNPIAKLRLKPNDRRRERRLLPYEEGRLLSEAEGMRVDYIKPLIALALETAMRRGELLRIRREHIDFARSLLLIPETKNGEKRTIPLTAKAIEILKHRRPNSEKERLFEVTETALRLSWVRLCRRASVLDLHFHDLRHEAISRFFELGLTTPEVALISGHKDVRMLFRYAHATQKSILAKFENTPQA